MTWGLLRHLFCNTILNFVRSIHSSSIWQHCKQLIMCHILKNVCCLRHASYSSDKLHLRAKTRPNFLNKITQVYNEIARKVANIRVVVNLTRSIDLYLYTSSFWACIILLTKIEFPFCSQAFIQRSVGHSFSHPPEVMQSNLSEQW